MDRRSNYRVVKRTYRGVAWWEAHFRRWWSPFWSQCDDYSCHATPERAENHARTHAADELPATEINLGRLP